MSIYYKHVPDGSKLLMLSYVDDYVYWYTSEELVKWFLDTLVNIFLVNSLGYENWSMPNIISQLNDYYISVDQDRYNTFVAANFLDAATVKENSKCC